jgi:hypothetical protein
MTTGEIKSLSHFYILFFHLTCKIHSTQSIIGIHLIILSTFILWPTQTSSAKIRRQQNPSFSLSRLFPVLSFWLSSFLIMLIQNIHPFLQNESSVQTRENSLRYLSIIPSSSSLLITFPKSTHLTVTSCCITSTLIKKCTKTPATDGRTDGQAISPAGPYRELLILN